MGELGEFTHSSYPHEWGALYDCPACESECFCEPHSVAKEEQCVHCVLLGEGI